MSTSRAIVGRIIKRQRKKKDLTQQQLGDMLGADKQYISMIENGKKNITLDYIDQVIKKLDDNHDDYFNTKD